MDISSAKIKWGIWLVLGLFTISILGYVFLYPLKPLASGSSLANQERNEYKTDLLELLYRELGGFNGPRRFLVLFQNSLELRPAGGFIGSFGIVEVNQGEIISFRIFNTNAFDVQNAHKAFTQPPSPIKQYLFVQNWQLRDSNWSPNFPDAARQALHFYQIESSDIRPVDAVVAFTPYFFVELLKIVGPVTLDDGVTFSSDKILEQLEYEVEIGFRLRNVSISQRKDILNEIAAELMEKIIPRLDDTQFAFGLRDLIHKQIVSKDILAYSQDTKIQALIRETGLDGGVDSDWTKDYLILVDANLGGLKTDLVMERKLEYEVDLRSIKPRSILKIRYHNPAKEQTFILGEYKDYVRVYVPQGSWLLNVATTGLETPVSFSQEFGRTVFSGFFRVPLNSEKTLIFEYTLPEHIIKNYELKIEKQPGVRVLPAKVVIHSNQTINGSDFSAKGILRDPFTVEFTENIVSQARFEL